MTFDLPGAPVESGSRIPAVDRRSQPLSADLQSTVWPLAGDRMRPIVAVAPMWLGAWYVLNRPGDRDRRRLRVVEDRRGQWAAEHGASVEIQPVAAQVGLAVSNGVWPWTMSRP